MEICEVEITPPEATAAALATAAAVSSNSAVAITLSDTGSAEICCWPFSCRAGYEVLLLLAVFVELQWLPPLV